MVGHVMRRSFVWIPAQFLIEFCRAVDQRDVGESIGSSTIAANIRGRSLLTWEILNHESHGVPNSLERATFAITSFPDLREFMNCNPFN